MKCKICHQSGHGSDKCAKRRKRSREKCASCGAEGHKTEDCNAVISEEDEEDEDEEEEEEEEVEASTPAAPSPAKPKKRKIAAASKPDTAEKANEDEESVDVECLLCHAAAGTECEAGCVSASTRMERIERSKSKMKPATTVTVQKISAVNDEDIAAMDAAGIARLSLKSVVMRAYTWTHWIAGGVNAADKRERHRTLFEALATALGVGVGDARGTLSAIDIHRARGDLEAMRELLDPSVGLGERINQYALERGQELVAIKDARERGWVEVRAALDIFKGSAQGDRKWGQALAKAAVQTKAKSTTVTTANSGSEGGRGGGGRGRGRFGKGGRGAKKGGKGAKDGGRGGHKDE